MVDTVVAAASAVALAIAMVDTVVAVADTVNMVVAAMMVVAIVVVNCLVCLVTWVFPFLCSPLGCGD